MYSYDSFEIKHIFWRIYGWVCQCGLAERPWRLRPLQNRTILSRIVVLLGVIHIWRPQFRGEGGLRFCDTFIQKKFFVWKQRGGGGLKIPFLMDVIYERPLMLMTLFVHMTSHITTIITKVPWRQFYGSHVRGHIQKLFEETRTLKFFCMISKIPSWQYLWSCGWKKSETAQHHSTTSSFWTSLPLGQRFMSDPKRFFEPQLQSPLAHHLIYSHTH